MTDEPESQSEEEQSDEPQGPVCGERLLQARRERQISVTEIAKELHLDEAKVRALERNDFGILGAPVFAKGHLKKYAAIVEVNVDDVLADYYRLDRSLSTPPVIAGRPKPQPGRSPGPWIIVVILVVAAVLVWWFLSSRDASNPDPGAGDVPGAPAAAVTRPAAETPASVDTDLGTAEDSGADQDDYRDPAAESQSGNTADTGDAGSIGAQAVATSADVAGEPPADGEVRLDIRFTGDCWTEISDGSGRRLFFDLGRSGRTVRLNGEAPLAVLFGDADKVELSVNGADYPIPATSRRGRTATLTIDRP